MSYIIFVTEAFLENYSKMDYLDHALIEKIKRNLVENAKGKILRYYWFREKKFGDKRLYYLVNEELHKILIVGFSSKKDQQKAIQCILENMEELLKELREI